MPRYPLLSNCVFRETFDSLSSVAQNGGAVTGTPTISNGLAVTAALSQNVRYGSMRTLFNNWSKATIYLDFTLASVGSAAQFYPFTKYSLTPSSDAQFLPFIIHNTGAMNVYIGGGSSNYAAFNLPATSGRFKYFFVYDGTLAAASRLKIYRVNADGSLTLETPTIVGTIPTTLGYSSWMPVVGGNDNNGTIASVGQIGDGVTEIDVFASAFSTDEMTDFVQRDTYSELDASKALVYLPLKSWYYKENGTQLLADGDMEAADTSAWTAYGGSNLTKQTASPRSGARYLRSTGTVINAGTRQTILATGKRYKVTGWARGDGTVKPRVLVGGGSVTWEGTSSASWQEVSLEAVADGVHFYLLQADNLAGYVEFDDFRVESMEARTDNIGSLGGHALLGDGSTTTTFPTQKTPHGMSFDGGDYFNIDMGIGPLLTLSMPFTFSVLMYDDKGLSDTTGYSIGGTWDTAQSKGILFYKYPSASYGPGVLIGSSSGNFIEARGNEAPPGIHLYTFTYDGSGTFAGLRIYIDGKLSSWINGSTGTLGADIVSGKGVMLGARWNGAASPHQFLTSGKRILDVSIYPFALTPVQVKVLYESLKKTLNV